MKEKTVVTNVKFVVKTGLKAGFNPQPDPPGRSPIEKTGG